MKTDETIIALGLAAVAFFLLRDSASGASFSQTDMPDPAAYIPFNGPDPGVMVGAVAETMNWTEEQAYDAASGIFPGDDLAGSQAFADYVTSLFYGDEPIA